MKRRIAKGRIAKGRIARILVLIATIAVLFFYPLIAPPPHRIDEAHLALIVPGMSEAEVEGIFGVPAGAYDWFVGDEPSIWIEIGAFQWSGRAQLRHAVVMFDEFSLAPGWIKPDFGYSRMWTSRHGVFFVTFDSLGRVSHTGNLGASRRDPPWNRWWRQWLSR
jgi:hypothetical protein